MSCLNKGCGKILFCFPKNFFFFFFNLVLFVAVEVKNWPLWLKFMRYCKNKIGIVPFLECPLVWTPVLKPLDGVEDYVIFHRCCSCIINYHHHPLPRTGHTNILNKFGTVFSRYSSVYKDLQVVEKMLLFSYDKRLWILFWEKCIWYSVNDTYSGKLKVVLKRNVYLEDGH